MAKGRRQRRSLLGVEFYDTEVRVVEVRFSGGKPIIMAAGSTAMPPNAIVEGEIVRADAVAFALRRLLDSLAVTTTEAVLGIPLAGYTTRSLNIPPTPPDEQAMLIEGEVRHFDILRTADGAYDYFTLASQETNEMSIILMAAEGHITSSVRSVAERAGLEVVALEPISIGMLRAACSSTTSGAAEGLYLVIGETGTEATVIRDNQIWLYRRIDIGTRTLFSTSGGPMDRIDHSLSREEEVELAKEQVRIRELRKGPADTLGIEVRRTMEFYAREFSGATPVGVLHLLLNDTLAEQLEPFLREAAGAEIQVVRPSGFVAQSDTANQEMSSEQAYRYCGAYGLALHKVEGVANFVPSLDLYVRERSIVAEELKRKTLTGSLAAGIVAVVVGISGTYYFGLQANHATHDLEHAKEELAHFRQEQQTSLKTDRETLEQISFLSMQGIPAVWFMDSLAAALDKGVGIGQVIFENETSVAVTGEASSIQALLLSVQNIQNKPGLGSASITSYESVDKDSNSGAVKFSLRIVRPGGAPATGGTP